MATQVQNPKGVPYSDMVAESETDFRVRTQVYTDPAVFDDEMREIFTKTWVYVGHESEIALAGDYKTTNMGMTPVIMSRLEDGTISVMMNECRHRGNAICREEYANSKTFRCPYHSWVYKNNGELIGPTQQAGYPPDFAEEIQGLITARVGTYRGLIFANFDMAGESLDEHLSTVKPYIDLWADISPTGTYRVLKPHKYSYAGNWKFMAENGFDGWHARFLHESAFKTMEHFGLGANLAGGGRGGNWSGHTSGLAHGHGYLERPWRGQGMNAEQEARYNEEIAAKHGAERAKEVIKVRHIFIFPNVYLFDNIIRVINPVSINETHVYSHFLSWPESDDELNRRRLIDLQRVLGTAGMVGVDDVEMFASNQTGMGGAMEWVVLSQSMNGETTTDTGERVSADWSETPHRSMYREWARLMTTNGSNGTSIRS